MPFSVKDAPPRCAVVDLGSNSVRLVVFEGNGRNPVPIFNEKAVLRLGKGLTQSGRLNDEGVAQALLVMERYAAIARAMAAAPFEVLCTAAVRDAANGPDFVEMLRQRLPGVGIHTLAGETEADFAAAGLLCGIPSADGILADIGGGSLEMVQIKGGQRGRAESRKLGVIRLSDRSGGDIVRARAIAEAELGEIGWLSEGAGRDLYLVGGAFRALARIHLAHTAYPLNMLHHYTISREEARDLAGVIAAASRRSLERMPSASRRRVDDLPYAAIVLRRLLRATMARRVIFSANGLREGWYMAQIPPDQRLLDPMISAGQDMARHFARDPSLPPSLISWTDPLFPDEQGESRRLREAACWMSDIGSHEHPEYRAEQACLRILRQPGVGLDHHARAFLATAIAIRYDADPEAAFLAPARMLLSFEAARRATLLGFALRLAYTLSAGTPDVLAGTRMLLNGKLVLQLRAGTGVFAGESLTRRLERLAQAMAIDFETATV